MQDIIPSNQSFKNRRPTVIFTERSVPVDRSAERRAAERLLYAQKTRTIRPDVVRVNPEKAEPVIIVEEVTEIIMTQPVEVEEAPSFSNNVQSNMLTEALVETQKSLKKERTKSRDLKRFSIVFIASMFVLFTGYVSIDTLITNNRVKAQVSNPVAETTGVTTTKATEGTDETQPATQSTANYTVAPTLPRILSIDKLNISARILPMSVNKDESIQAPQNIFDAGWYNGSVKPGEDGAVFIDGHASGPSREGLFAYLDQLTPGDEIRVEKGDGTTLTYGVVHVEVVPLEGLDMKKVLKPYGNTVKGLNLMTCTGTWVDAQKTYDKRVIVYTEQLT